MILSLHGTEECSNRKDEKQKRLTLVVLLNQYLWELATNHIENHISILQSKKKAEKHDKFPSSLPPASTSETKQDESFGLEVPFLTSRMSLSSSDYRHSALSQTDEEDHDIPTKGLHSAAQQDDNNDTPSRSAPATTKFSPLELEEFGSEEHETNHQFGTTRVQPQRRTPTSTWSSSLSPLFRWIAETEHQRTHSATYQHVIGDDHDDDDDHPDEFFQEHTLEEHNDEDEDLLDGVTPVRTSVCPLFGGSDDDEDAEESGSTRFWYRSVACLLVVLVAAIVLVPATTTTTRSTNHHHHARGSYARTCRKQVFDQAQQLEGDGIHSWQSFQTSMATNQNWCRPPRNTHQHSTSNSDCLCASRVEAKSRHPDGSPNSHNPQSDEETEPTGAWDVAVAKQNVQTLLNHTSAVDVVFLGDDRMARWRGMVQGTVQPELADNIKVFDHFFTRQPQQQEAQISGVSMAVSGDECPHLLYRLRHTYANALTTLVHHAPIWWLVIGTNDVVTHACAYPGVLAGILALMTELQRQSPHSTIVINSLLPTKDMHLWNKTIHPLNQALQCYVAGLDYDVRVEFLDVTDLFLDNQDSSLIPRRNESLFASSFPNIHDDDDEGHQAYPNALGYQIWGQAIVEKIQELRGKRRRLQQQ